jgi:NDP-sugar pyrophosphorylase family protein
MTNQAIIMAGGKGSRLRPYTDKCPKPLVPLNGIPMLEIILRQLAHAEFRHVTIALNHAADQIRDFCEDGSRFGLRVNYSQEREPLGTIGPLKLISDLSNNFLVMNADILTDLSYRELMALHCMNENLMTIGAASKSYPVSETLLSTNGAGMLTGFQEKPLLRHIVSAGIFALNKSVLDLVPESTLFGYDELVMKMLGTGLPVRVFQHQGYWVDMGRPEDYVKASADFSLDPARFISQSI